MRDLLLGVPVVWLTDYASMILALCAGLAAFFFANFWARLHALVWLYAAGLALFAVVGASKAYAVDGSFLVSVFMGALTATAGGLIRDVVCNESPMLLPARRSMQLRPSRVPRPSSWQEQREYQGRKAS